jgi:50S ribosomal subunit-associated GTPase HflX
MRSSSGSTCAIPGGKAELGRRAADGVRQLRTIADQPIAQGESDLDLDRRKIRDRLAELKEQLEDIQRDNDQRRSARRDKFLR